MITHGAELEALTEFEPLTDVKRAVLLGAGASVAAGLPTTTEMADRIREVVRGEVNNTYSGISDALEFAYAAILKHQASVPRRTYGVDRVAFVDVERLFSAILLLSERSDHEASPFVDVWDPSIDRFGHPRSDPFAARSLCGKRRLGLRE